MLKLCIGVFIFEKRKFRNNFQSKKKKNGNGNGNAV